jgi:hypothetical protein
MRSIVIKNYHSSKNVSVAIGIIISILIGVYLRISPYLINKYDFLIGFDSGKYVHDFIYGTSTSISSLDFWVEPGFNTVANSLNSLIHLQPFILFMYILPSFLVINFCLISFLLVRKLTDNSGYSVFAAFIAATSPVLLNGIFDSYYRQLFATIIFMAFLYFIINYVEGSLTPKYPALLFGLLGGGIIVTHRAITLLYGILLIVCIAYAWKKNMLVDFKQLILSGIGALIFSAPYWIIIGASNLHVLTDAIHHSGSAKSGGNTTLKNVTRSDNQILAYFKNVFISIFAFLGILISIKRRGRLYVSFVILIVVYIGLKLTFANRFLLNLDLLLIPFIILAIAKISHSYSKSLAYCLIVALLTLQVITAVKISQARRPYILENDSSTIWFEKNIARGDTLIVAPDSLSTILASLGYDTAIYALPTNTKNDPDAKTIATEDFLINGYKHGATELDIGNKKYSHIYVVVNSWYMNSPQPHLGGVFPDSDWQTSHYAKIIYSSNKSISRVYELKRQ